MTRTIYFVGAGASAPFGVPAMAQMTASFEAKISKVPSPEYKLYDELKYRLRDYPIYDLEAMITILQDIINIQDVPRLVFSHPSVVYFSTCAHRYNGMIDMMARFGSRHKESSSNLLQLILAHIGEVCTPSSTPFHVYDGLFEGAADGRGVSVYTTNYDQVLEQYCHSRGLEYEVGQADGGLLNISCTNPRLYGQEKTEVCIYKLHGSVNWYRNQDGDLRWLSPQGDERSRPILDEEVIQRPLIYPVVEKLVHREPFYPMFHQLRTDLANARHCYVAGYSFRDIHILDTFHDCLDTNPRLNLTIIDPNGQDIAYQKFAGYEGRIQVEARDFADSAIPSRSP